MTFHERKRKRTAHYLANIYMHKLVTCTACNGSGYYDNSDGSHCGGCDGTGRERKKTPRLYFETLDNPEMWMPRTKKPFFNFEPQS